MSKYTYYPSIKNLGREDKYETLKAVLLALAIGVGFGALLIQQLSK